MIDSQVLNTAIGAPAPRAPGAPSSGGAAASKLDSNTLGKDAFLKLLIVQLRNQDPLNPLDQNQFLAQTAQFNSLEQLQSINKELGELNDANKTGVGLGQAASLLGRTVQIAEGDLQYSGAPPALSFSLDGHATSVQVQILDAQGNVVQTLSTDALDAGAHAITWDGADSNGQRMTPGTYTYRVSASGTSGAPAPTAWVDEGTVTGLTSQGGQVLYRVGDDLVREEDIVSIH